MPATTQIVILSSWGEGVVRDSQVDSWEAHASHYSNSHLIKLGRVMYKGIALEIPVVAGT